MKKWILVIAVSVVLAIAITLKAQNQGEHHGPPRFDPDLAAAQHNTRQAYDNIVNAQESQWL